MRFKYKLLIVLVLMLVALLSFLVLGHTMTQSNINSRLDDINLCTQYAEMDVIYQRRGPQGYEINIYDGWVSRVDIADACQRVHDRNKNGK